jgi:hypothetical protein
LALTGVTVGAVSVALTFAQGAELDPFTRARVDGLCAGDLTSLRATSIS